MTRTALQVLLDWYAAALEGEPASWLPRVASSGWHQRKEPGMTANDWHDCEQCNDGVTKRGPCKNCTGVGGWYVDRYDHDNQRIGDTATQVERAMTPAEYDKAIKDGRKQLTIEQQLALLSSPITPPSLRKVEASLMRMRQPYPHERGAIVCVHLLRLPIGQVPVYYRGLDTLQAIVGPYFKPPGWVNDTARARDERARTRKAAA